MTALVDGLPNGKVCPASLASYHPDESDASHPERKVTTLWDATWELKAQESEPKLMTTWVYNYQIDPIANSYATCAQDAPFLPDGQPIPVLCTRYEQATTDLTGELGLLAPGIGPIRQWNYTYNRFGQVLTKTTPKMSSSDTLSHTTTYSYYSETSFVNNIGHTIGDLFMVTNALGQSTTFTSYDAAGHVLSSLDANGTTVTSSYWPRGWLKSQTITPSGGTAAPQVTTYTYWPTGLLRTATMVDGSTLFYAYDEAHRLTDITDGASNKIHYLLDSDGNRTGEQVTDESGKLASSLTRVYDALNRLQSVTGALH